MVDELEMDQDHSSTYTQLADDAERLSSAEFFHKF